jgi:two-component system sensor histidine kinase QseC
MIDLGDLGLAVCAEQAILALQRNQILALQVEPNLPPVRGNGDMLTILLCNLVGNSINYTQNGGHIYINIRSHESGCLIEVIDDGPGIPATKREQVFNRFFRNADSSQPGIGLGLAISRRIVELHNASIELADGTGGIGLTVRVLLPNK